MDASTAENPRRRSPLSPSSITAVYKPDFCERRLWLRDVSSVDEAPTGAFQQYLFDQGIAHEERVTESFIAEGREVIDLSDLKPDDRVVATAEAIRSGGTAIITQGQIDCVLTLTDGSEVEVTGRPDFLIPASDGWVISDAKVSRSLHEPNGRESSKRKEIFHQLRLYGLMFEKVFPGVPFELCVYNGSGNVEQVEWRAGEGVLGELERIMRLRLLEDEPYEQVGLTKCGMCGFRNHCWPAAESSHDLGLVPSIDKRRGAALRNAGVGDYLELAEGAAADRKGVDVPAKVREEVEALITGVPVRRCDDSGNAVALDPAVSSDPNYVMFDLEGIPPELDIGQRIYLWGMQVFGRDPGEFIPALAGFGEEGDREGWEAFLAAARAIIDAHPGIRFVHWAPYERTMIRKYVERYGDDRAGTAAEVEPLLLDLWPITKAVVAIPAPGYSLKVVEKLDAVRDATGFTRTVGDVGKGDESIVAYAEASETEDPAKRERIMNSLCEYNREDLEATWAVQKWLRSMANGRD